MKALLTTLVLALTIAPASAGSILDAMQPPSEALLVSFETSPDTDVLKPDQPLDV